MGGRCTASELLVTRGHETEWEGGAREKGKDRVGQRGAEEERSLCGENLDEGEGAARRIQGLARGQKRQDAQQADLIRK